MEVWVRSPGYVISLFVLPGDQFFQKILGQNGLGMAIDIGGPEDGVKWCVSKSVMLEFSHIVEENADIFSFHSLIHIGMWWTNKTGKNYGAVNLF